MSGTTGQDRLTFGVLLPTRPNYLEMVPGLERCGYEEVWFPDFQLAGADPFVTMACQAALTTHLRFGVCVTNPLTRHVTVMANTMASLNLEFPGRVGLGIGVGASPLKALGLKAAKLSELRRYIDECRDLMDGRPAVLSEAGPVRFLEFWRDPLEGLPRVPIRVAAGGPLSLRQAGMIADEVIIGTIDEDLLSIQLAHVREGAREVGRDPATIGVVVMAAVYLGAPETSVDELRAHVGGYVPNMLMSNAASVDGREDEVTSELADAFSLIKSAQQRVASQAKESAGGRSSAFEGYMEAFPAEYDKLVNLTTLRAKALFGTDEEIRSRLDGLAELGVTSVVLYPDPKDQSALAAFASKFVTRTPA